MQIRFQRLILVSCLMGALMLGSCDSPKKSQADSQPTPPAPTASTISPSSTSDRFPGLPRLNGKAKVLMIVKGNQQIEIEVDGNNAPITAGNFIDLVQRKFYDGLTFHRVEKVPQPFVVQGGDPNGNGTGGYIPAGSSSERRIPLEIKPSNSSSPIVYSQKITDTPALQHKRGTIAMARSSSPDSASSQFYFPLTDALFLDGSYAVFGKITKGVDIIDTIAKGDKIVSAKVIQGIENLKK